MTKKSILDIKETPQLVYCRKCTKSKRENEYYKSKDLYLDTNTFLSICKDCCQIIYEDAYRVSQNVDQALVKTCKTLNIVYLQSASDGLKTHIQNNIDEGKEVGNVFGVYLRLISPHARGINTDGPEDLTYQDVSQSPIVNNSFSLGTEEKNEELVKFWGDGFNSKDYEYLENQYSQWVHTHRADTMAEITLLKEIVYKQLEIQKDRLGGHSTAAGVKQLQEIMKTASVDPSKANIAGAGKSQDTFSSFIKMIEENEPASFYEDKDLFEDFKDQKDLDFYFQKYVLRPLKNFVTQSRDFSVEVDDDNDEDGIDLVEMGTDIDNVKSDDETKIGE